MKVIEIFDSIDGEGVRVGAAATFIRLAGCNLRCSYCDTAYALFGEKTPCEYTEMTAEEIADKVNMNFKRVTLTGGEPLIHKDADKLINILLVRGIEVNVETNGAADITPFISDSERLFFTIDYKLSSSGESGKMLWSNFQKLRACDVVKFVVGSKEDVEEMKMVVSRLKDELSAMPHLYAGTVFGAYDTAELVNDIISDKNLSEVRVQLQIHKYIWKPDERGV